MTTKEIMQKVMAELPEDAALEDAIDRLLYIQGIQRGLDDVTGGRVISHEELLKQIETWGK